MKKKSIRAGTVTSKEVAEHLGVCVRTIERYVRAGWLPVIRLSGKTQWFVLADVDKAVADHSQMMAKRTE